MFNVEFVVGGMDQGEYEASLPPVPERLTVVMINTFVAQTTQLLNRLSETCETKLADAQRCVVPSVS